MPIEFDPTKQTQAPKYLESLKQTFKQRKDAIWNKRLTVENIETFADDALNDAVKLTQDILKEYRSNPNVHARPTTLPESEQENEAFEIFNLPNINDILDQISAVKDQTDSLKKYLEENVEFADTVITPPQENLPPSIHAGSGTFEKKKLLPRLLTLMYILEHDFEITPTRENVKIVEGVVTKDMMRKTPYVRIEIPELSRAVYICDEEGNVSYIFDSEKLAVAGLKLEEIDLDDKRDKDSLIAHHPGIGIRIRQTPNWVTEVSNVLREVIPQTESELLEKQQREERGAIETRGSEFKKKEWLPFSEFQAEVKNLYPGRGDVSGWYQQEQKKHPNWPSQPYSTYKNKGWASWPELARREGKFLTFEKFQSEVRNLYPGSGIVDKWYKQEKKKHHNWPSHPSKIYKNKGWTGWPELVSKENRLKIKFLTFKELADEVRELYQGSLDVAEWYQ